jgi:uncharacterized membrane protein YfcA
MELALYVWLLAGLTFVVAGLVKGVIGMGLPTIAMGLLSLVLPPVQAAAVLVVPSLVTNVWQLVAGANPIALFRRLQSMMAGVVVGTLAGAGILVGNKAGLAVTALGVALVLYALVGLAGLKISVGRRHELWLAPLVGATTGLVTGATGVFVLPAVPYLQAIGLTKDELVQALGLSFTVSTIALAAGLLHRDAFPSASAGLSLMALAPASGGMWLGQRLRRRLDASAFRRVFFAGLFVLGLYLALRGIA